ncbi:isoprenoid synthase domain-containing protein, partial [Rhizoctonia solani]
AITQEMVDKYTGHVQTLEEYRRYRQDTSGVKLSLAMLEYAHQVDIPYVVLHNPVVSELSLAANEILTWANDIFSFRNEYARGHTHNLVFILMWHNQLEIQDAVDHANKLIEQRLQDYLEAKSNLPSFGLYLDSEVTRYIQALSTAHKHALIGLS